MLYAFLLRIPIKNIPIMPEPRRRTEPGRLILNLPKSLGQNRKRRMSLLWQDFFANDNFHLIDFIDNFDMSKKTYLQDLCIILR
jgi:Cft2 family RNA processing exonuclease